jgi:rRNA-processing protein FCF1
MMPELIRLADRLRQQMQLIENQMMELLDASTIEKFRNDTYSKVVVIAPCPRYYWSATEEHQKLLQMQLLKAYSTWFEHFQLLFREASKETRKQIEKTHKFVTSWIEKEGSWDVPSTIQQAKSQFRERIQIFYELLQMLDSPDGRELVLVPDTNALIVAPDLSQYSKVAGQVEYTVVIVPTVLEELDKLKLLHLDKDFRDKVASVIKRIKGMRHQGSLLTGVTVNRTVTVIMRAQEPNFGETLHWLDSSNKDDRIIASVLELQRAHPFATVVLVTSDINLQNKAEMADLPFVEPPAGG